MVWKRTETDTAPTPSSPSPAPASPPRSQTTARGGEHAVIGSSITVEGDVRGEEDLTILGRVRGTVDVKGNSITVGQSGRVEADLHADLIVVEGRVEGNLFGGDQIILRSTADVQGNLTAPRVALDDGAQFKGAIDMEPASKGRSGSSTSPSSGSGPSSTSTGSGSSGSGPTGSGSSSPSGSSSDTGQESGASKGSNDTSKKSG